MANAYLGVPGLQGLRWSILGSQSEEATDETSKVAHFMLYSHTLSLSDVKQIRRL